MHKITIQSSKIFLLIISIFYFFSFVNASEVETNSDKYLLYNLNDNEIIMEKNSHIKTSIASLTKIATVITAIENIENLEEKITITNEMIEDIENDVAVVGFKVGDILTYEDLLYSSILRSGADATNALAFSISGSIEKYVNLMNDLSAKLNLKNTRFANTIGLYDENNYSSAYDIAMILKYALENKTFKKIFETHEYTLTNGIKIKSTITRKGNELSHIIGAKTGYIKAAGNCLATTSNINGVNLILVSLNAPKEKKNLAYEDTIKIYDYIEKNYSYKNVLNKNDVITRIQIEHSKEKKC